MISATGIDAECPKSIRDETVALTGGADGMQSVAQRIEAQKIGRLKHR